MLFSLPLSVCDNLESFTSGSPFLCMDLSYITALLKDGFGFADDTLLKVRKSTGSYSCLSCCFGKELVWWSERQVFLFGLKPGHPARYHKHMKHLDAVIVSEAWCPVDTRQKDLNIFKSHCLWSQFRTQWEEALRKRWGNKYPEYSTSQLEGLCFLNPSSSSWLCVPSPATDLWLLELKLKFDQESTR